MAIVVTSNEKPQEALHTEKAETKEESKVEGKESVSTEEVQEDETQLEESETSEESDEEENDSKDSSEEDEDSREEESQEEDKDEKKASVPKGVKKRFRRFQRKLSEKDQEIEYWKKEALKGQAPKASESENSVEQFAEASGEPKEEDFEHHKDYVKALAKWAYEEEKQRDLAKSKEAETKSTFQSRVREFKEQTKDFDEVVSEVDDVRLSVGIQEVLLSSKLGPQLMYELAQDRDELERINLLSPIDAARELGRLEAKISFKSKESSSKETKKTTKAPPPPTRVSGKSEKALKKSIYDEDLSFKDYERIRLEELKARANSF